MMISALKEELSLQSTANRKLRHDLVRAQKQSDDLRGQLVLSPLVVVPFNVFL